MRGEDGGQAAEGDGDDEHGEQVEYGDVRDVGELPDHADDAGHERREGQGDDVARPASSGEGADEAHHLTRKYTAPRGSVGIMQRSML